jgi:hypothetical protein
MLIVTRAFSTIDKRTLFFHPNFGLTSLYFPKESLLNISCVHLNLEIFYF